MSAMSARSRSPITLLVSMLSSRMRAYYRAACRFPDWCEGRKLFDLAAVEPLDVAAFIEGLQATHCKLTVKQHLAALRMLFDWLVVGHVIDVNSAHSVRGPP